MLMSWVNQIQCRRPLYMYLLYVRRGHTMTTVEGQLAVLGGAATRPQGETEVSNSRIFLIKNTLLSLKRDQRRASGQSVGKESNLTRWMSVNTARMDTSYTVRLARRMYVLLFWRMDGHWTTVHTVTNKCRNMVYWFLKATDHHKFLWEKLDVF